MEFSNSTVISKRKLAVKGESFGYYTCVSDDCYIDDKSKSVTQDFVCQCGTVKRKETKQLRYAVKYGFTPKCDSCRGKDTWSKSLKAQEAFRERRDRVKCGLISGTFFNHISQSAKTRNIEFDVTIEQLWNLAVEQKFKCALSGMEIVFTLERKKNDPNFDIITASLDRIDSKKGYVIGNIQWLHKDVNKMKREFDEDYFISVCKMISKVNKQNDEFKRLSESCN